MCVCVSVQAVRVLDDEAGEDARERAKHGGSWNRPESAQLAAPMRERLETYRQNLTQAEESDRSLAGRMGESAAMFSHLHADRVGMLLPPLQVRVCVCGGVCACGCVGECVGARVCVCCETSKKSTPPVSTPSFGLPV